MKGVRKRVALVFGGCSAEHEVSLRSARSVFEAMDKDRYEAILVLITRDGAWYVRPAHPASFDDPPDLDEKDRLVCSHDPVHKGFLRIGEDGRLETMMVEAIFPVLHGTYGEDGTLQGLLELANIPYVGCGVLASAVGMDKVLMKAAFQDRGLTVGPFSWFLRSEWRRNRAEVLKGMSNRTFPLFVKPANLGSSVGISRVPDRSGLEAAIELAARYDRKVLVEDSIPGRELEVSVLGNEDPIASVPGEIVSHTEFYDYTEKYITDTAELIIPADLPESVQKEAGKVAVTAFKAVDGSGLARVDMFLTPEGQIVVNEINTMPGFTSISMYPKLLEASGISYGSLVDKLIDLAIERHRDKQHTVTDRNSS
jgi:D-alanine-D-alanine ligase